MSDIKCIIINDEVRNIMPAVMDSVPTENSTNPITSGGVKTYVNEFLNNQGNLIKDIFYTEIIPDGLCHNSFYREKDITADYLSGKVSANIANETFHDIFPGDRITLNGRTYVVGGLDSYLGKGNYPVRNHHILMFPLTILGTEQMNPTDITTGGYMNSKSYKALHSTASGSYYETILGDFGSNHLIQHRALLSNETIAQQGAMYYDEESPGRSSYYVWSAEYLSLMSEVQVYGSIVTSSSAYDIGEGCEQIPTFRLNSRLIYSPNASWWLRGVASGSRFCCANNDSYATDALAGDSCGVRPFFLII